LRESATDAIAGPGRLSRQSRDLHVPSQTNKHHLSATYSVTHEFLQKR